KFTQHILPNSHFSRNKESDLDKSDYECYEFGWATSISQPVDYERFLAKHRTSILSDPHRELVLFPPDDIQLVRVPFVTRIINAGAPQEVLESGAFSENSLARHALSFITTTQWTCEYEISSIYRGHFSKLPRHRVSDSLTQLAEHWFAIDQPDPHKASIDPGGTGGLDVSPSRASMVSAGARPWTAAVVGSRSRHNGPNVPSNEGDGKKELRSHQQLSLGRLAECPLAVCSREVYNAYMRVREKHLANGRADDNTTTSDCVALIKPKLYCLRQLQLDEVSNCLNDVSTAEVKKMGFTFRPGLHVIAPIDWRPFDRSGGNQSLSEVVCLDTVDAVHIIGDRWLKMDRTITRAGPIRPTNGGGDRWDAGSELFLYFENLSQRPSWLSLIQEAIAAERSRQRLGYYRHQSGSGNELIPTANQNSQPAIPRPRLELLSSVNSQVNQNDSTLFTADSDSVRSALQRYTQETDFLINHQRQKSRVKLITIYPEVRFAYDRNELAANERFRKKLWFASQLTQKRGQKPASLRGTQIDQACLDEVNAQDSPPLPFPDRTLQSCGRRFLVTCLKLQSRLQAVFDSPGLGGVRMDNPEPYFVTMFLVDTSDGRRVSEDFWWDPNSTLVDSMLAADLFRQVIWGSSSSIESKGGTDTTTIEPQSPTSRSNRTTAMPKSVRASAPPPPPSSHLSTPLGVSTGIDLEHWRKCRSALFSIPTNLANVGNVFLVIRVDKVLNGSISTAVEKYVKGAVFGGGSSDKVGTESKIASAINRSMISYCRHLGRYRMPFAWGAKSLASRSHVVHLFKMDPNKVAESALIQLVQSLARLSDATTHSGHTNGTSPLPPTSAEEAVAPSWSHTVVDGLLYDKLSAEVIERQLRTQALPFNFEVAISELNQQPSEQANKPELVTPDLLRPRSSHPNDGDISIPSTHPLLERDELVREVEHMFDFRLPSSSQNTQSGEVLTTASSDSENPVHASGSARRVPYMGSNNLQSGVRSSRDSMISTSSVGNGGTSILADQPRLSSSAVQSRTASLDRTRIVGEPSAGQGRTAVPADSAVGLVPFTTFLNTLYISPKSLNLSVKHNFSRARNLSCFIELRSNDSLEASAALKVFFTRPSVRQPPFDSWWNTAILYHDTSPFFNDMAKICLPLHLTPQHHLLFRFYHVSVDTAGSLSTRDRPLGKKPLESSTGYTWLPILGSDGNINTGTFNLPIAQDIQPGYLRFRANLGRGSIRHPTNNGLTGDGENISWLDNGKPLFTVNLDCLSSIYTRDPVLSRFFRACGDLLRQVFALPSPLIGSGLKSKSNRVTFREDLIEDAHPQPSGWNNRVSSLSSSSATPSCGLHLCNAIKSLLLIDSSALVHFLPSVMNQFMEIILISATTGHRWTSSPGATGAEIPSSIAWLDSVKPNSTSTPNDILKTTVGTMTMLISELNFQCPSSKDTPGGNYYDDYAGLKTSSDGYKHDLLKAYVKFAFDADRITLACINFHSTPTNNESSAAKSPGTTLPLHHALVRGLILLLADPNCADHILFHLFANLWFPLALIIKSMTQYLFSSQKIRADRTGDSRFSEQFSDDLALLIKSIGSRLGSSNSTGSKVPRLAFRSSVGVTSELRPPSVSGSSATASRYSTASVPVRTSGRSMSNPSGATQRYTLTSMPSLKFPSNEVEPPVRKSSAQPETALVAGRTGVFGYEFNAVEVMSATVHFICHLINLMDRGYVMNRIRDLMIFLEILPRMSVEEIDRLNELRYRLLSILSQHEHFVQLNLPFLNPFQGTTRQFCELHLTERFKQEHFLVGCILSNIACLLSGCVNTGGWATGATANHLYREPLRLLRDVLAKHSLDPRYANSKQSQSRINALYLPLVHLILENCNVLGSPGGALQAAVIAAAARGEFNDTDLRETASVALASDVVRRKRTTASQAPSRQSGAVPASRPWSMISDLSAETIAAVTSMQSVPNSESAASLSLSNGSGGSISFGPNASSSITGSSTSNASVHSAAYLTEDGKVEQHILDQIAGINLGGPLQRVQWRRTREGAMLNHRNSSLHSANGSQNQLVNHVSSSHTSSTLTLTGPDVNLPSSANERMNDDPAQPFDSVLDDIRMVDDGRDDETQGGSQDWANQVLTLAGVLPNDPQAERSPPEAKNDRQAVNGDTLPSEKSQADRSVSSPLICAARSLLPADQDHLERPHQHRRPGGPAEVIGPRRLTDRCQRELFTCMLHILSSVTDECLTALYQSFTIQERIHFLNVLNYAIQHLRYRGKKCIQQYEHISRSGVGRVGMHSGMSAVTLNSMHGTSSSRRAGTLLGKYPHSASSLSGLDSSTDSKDLSPGAPGEDRAKSKVLLEANLATEAGLIILDLLHLFSSVFKKELESCKPSDPVFRGILDVYIALLTHNPSEHLLRHTFAALRMFTTRYCKVLFSSSTEVLSALCLAGLRCANQCVEQTDTSLRLKSSAHSTAGTIIAQIRLEACGFLYKLWKTSFETYGRPGFHRVHLQTIISVSKLVSEIGPGFEPSLSVLHSLVESDMRRSPSDRGAGNARIWTSANTNQFLDDVDDLIRRIRTVLMATAEMRQHNDDHERLVDLQYCLAKSYSSNPALRRTWLEELAKLHMNSKSFAELAMAKLHIAALMAEYLKRRAEFPQGCETFKAISSNICEEENGLRTDSALLEIPYAQEDLLVDINEAAVTLEAAGLFEAIRPVYALVIPIYEARQDYTALAQVYRHIGRSYEAIGRAETSGQRLFAAYFRVGFYGQQFESLAGKSFIYRANACQKLSGMCNDLLNLYRSKYGADSVELLTDYFFNRTSLDPSKAYVQVTYVEPYKERTDCRKPLSSYEKHHDVRQFMFETPFLLQPGLSTTASLFQAGPKRSEDLTQQWKRRTVLTTEASFPHLRTRLEVIKVTETDMSPIDAAIDAIECKNQELLSHALGPSPTTLANATDAGNGVVRCDDQHVSVTSIGLHPPVQSSTDWGVSQSSNGNGASRKPHSIPLLMDMQLQGALLPTVNVGPMAYAEAFLKAENQVRYPQSKVARLRELFFEFLTACLVLLTRYYHLMSSVHEAKYVAMRQALDRYRVDLSNLLKEEIMIDERKLIIGPKSATIDGNEPSTPSAEE
ncbi:unnamed protein product, partial [Calicophoron daubneyi]